MRLMFILTLLSILLGLPLASAAVDVANVDIVLTNQNPYPAEPGGNVDVEIEIQNKGLTDATNVMIEVFPKDPFSLLPGQEKTKRFTRITAGESVKATYTLSVSDKALSSDYELEFRIYSSPLKENYVKKTVTILVQGEPHLIVEDVITYPQTIEPGGNVKLVAVLKNVGSGTARDVEISINSSSPEILPVLSGGRAYIGDIEANTTKEAVLKMSIGADAEHRTYLATLLLNYKDESNIQRGEVFLIGIPVAGTINLHVINVEPDFERETLDIEVANQGTTDAKSIEARLVVNEKTIGVDYISQLKAIGVFDEINGLIVGVPYRYNRKMKFKLIELLKKRLSQYDFPILFGVNFGHTDPIITLPYGIKAVIESSENKFQILESAVK